MVGKRIYLVILLFGLSLFAGDPHCEVLTLDQVGGSLSEAVHRKMDPGSFTVSAVHGNVVVMRYAGAVDDFEVSPEHPIDFLPRQEMMRAFYAQIGDVYDLVAFTTDFAYVRNGTLGFHVQLKNDIQGIGLPLVDYSATFHSSGKLQGMIELGAATKYLREGALTLDVFQNLMLHEIGHRWLAHVSYLVDGQISANLRMESGGHWSFLLDSDASYMYGHQWQEAGDGTWTVTDARSRYSDLDLYLMGFLPAEEVAPITLLHSSEIPDRSNRFPTPAATIRATAETIDISQIIAAEGPRDPGYANRARSLRVAFVFLHIGPAPEETILAQFNGGLAGLDSRFQRQTKGLGHLDFRPSPYAASASAADFANGWNYLEAQRQGDAWADTDATLVRDTVEVIRAQVLHGRPFETALTALKAHQDRNLDDVARIAALLGELNRGDEARIALLQAERRADGGFALRPGRQSSALDTALALNAFVSHSQTSLVAEIQAAVAFLLGNTHADGSWGQGEGTAFETAVVLEALQRQTVVEGAEIDLARARATTWLLSYQGAYGGIGQTDVDYVVTCHLQRALALTGTFNPQVSMFLERSQAANGSWNNRVHTTALVLTTLKQLETLQVADVGLHPDRVTFSPNAPVSNQPFLVTAGITNHGNAPAEDVTLTLYLNDTDAGGTAQVSSTLANPLLPGETRPAQLSWPVPAGLAQYSVVLEVSTASDDASPANNRISYDFFTDIPGPDPLIESEEVLFSTTDPLLGEVLQIRVPVLNAGGEPATGLSLTLYDGNPDNSGQIIAGPVVLPDLGAFQRVTHVFDWTVPAPLGVRTLFLILETDLDERPQNNRTSRQIQIRDIVTGVDLGINPLSLVLSPTTYQTVPQTFAVSFEIISYGATSATGLTARLYRGSPESGGLLLDSSSHPVSDVAPVPVTLSAAFDHLADYDLFATVEPQGGEVDQRPANNRQVLRLEGLSLEDLEVVPGSLEAAPLLAGGDVSLQAIFRNRNLLPRTGIVVAFEVDTGSGYQLVGRKTLGVPGAGSAAASVVWSAPATPVTGTFRVVVDPDGVIPEVDENDNETTLAFETRPDTLANLTLVDDAISFSAPPYHEGERLDVSVVVANTGGSAAEGTVMLFLNNESNGPLVPAVIFPELAPGEQTTVMFSLDPIAFRGDQLVMARVETSAEESNTEDNIAYRSIYVVGGPNPTFGPTPISLNPSWPAEGELVEVAVSLENRGALAATGLVVDLRGSDDLGDLIERRVLDLAPGQLETTFQITASAGLRSLVCILDPENQIVEQVETDNRAVLGMVLRDGEMALDETIFSPNGDGIKDQVTLFWARPESRMELLLTNSLGDVVRRWTDLPGSGSLVWAGRNEQGKLLGDGFYTFQLIDPTNGFALRDQTVAIDTNRGTIADSLATSDPGFYSISDPEKDLGFGWFGWAEDASSLLADSGSSGPALYVAPDGSHSEALGDPSAWAVGGRSIAGYPGQWLVRNFDGLFAHFRNGETVRQISLGYDDSLQAWVRPETALVWNYSSLNLVDLRDGSQTTLEIPERSWGTFLGAFVHGDLIYVLESDFPDSFVVGRILTWDVDGGNFAVYREYLAADVQLVQRQGRYLAIKVEPEAASADIIFFDLDQDREVRWSQLYPGTEADADKVFDDARLHLAPVETGSNAFGVVGDWVTNRRFVVSEASLKLLREKISPAGTAIAASGWSEFGQAIFTTRHNLGLNFEAFATGVGAVQIQGTATDRHLQNWQLDYALPSQPDRWFPTGISGDFQILDAFMGIWVPENAGTYLLRLTARDLAGNQKSRKTVVEVIETLPFHSLLRDPFFFSPNNDGKNDLVTLSFTVRTPFEGNLVVTGEDGAPVRSITRFYGSAGPATLSWDGRDNGGNLLPDGPYRLNFNGLSYSVVLDNSAPKLQFDFVASLRREVQTGEETKPTVATCYEMLVNDAHIRSWRLERRPVDAQDWILVRTDSGNYQTSPYDEFPDFLPTIRQVLGQEFRLVAEDIAGNTTTLSRVPNLPTQVWTMAGPSQTPFLAEGQEPLTTLAYGGIELLEFEAVLPQNRFPLTLTALEYGLSAALSNPTVVPSPLAAETVFEGPFFEPGLLDRNLPAEDNLFFRLVLTDALGTVYRTEVIKRLNIRFQVELISLAQRSTGDYRVEYRVTSDARTDRIVGSLLGLQDRAGRFSHPVSFGNRWEPGEECIQTFVTKTSTTWPDDQPPSPGNELGRWNRFILDDVILFAGSPNQVRLGRFVSQQFCSFSVTFEAVAGCRQPGDARNFDVYFPIQVLSGGSLRFYADEAGQVPISETMNLQNGVGTIALDDTVFNGEGWFPIYASLKDQDGRNITFDPSSAGDRLSFQLVDRTEAGNLIQLAGALYVTTEPIQPIIGDQVLCAPSALEIAAWNSDHIAIPRTIDFRSGRIPLYKPFESTRYRLPASPLYRLWAQPLGLDEPVVPLSINSETQAVINLGRLLGYDTWEIHLQAINEAGYCDESLATLTFSDFGGGVNGDFRILEGNSQTQTLFSPLDDVKNTAKVRVQVLATAGFAAWVETTGEPAEVVSVLRGGGSLPVGFHDLQWNGRNDEGNLVADGTYRMVIVSYAACGATHEESIAVTLDTQPPVARIDKPIEGMVRLPAPIQVTATDENYLESVALTVVPAAAPENATIHYQDTLPPNLVGSVLPALNLEPGEFTLRWLVEDRAGNQTEVTRTITVERHLTLEIFELTQTWISPNGDSVQDGTVIRYGLSAAAPVSLAVRQRAPGTGSWRLLDNVATPAGVHERLFNGEVDALALEDGPYEVAITVHGVGGDEVAVADLFLDRMEPTFTANLPQAGDVYDRQPMPVRIDISDGPGLIASWRLEHQSPSVARHTLAQGFDTVIGTTLAEISNPAAGQNSLFVSATDKAGNSNTQTLVFIRDPFAPVVTLETPEDDTLIAGNVIAISGRFAEEYPEALELVLVDEAEEETELAVLNAQALTGSTFAYTANLNGLADGRYTLRAAMMDQPGHRGEDLVSFVLDTQPPQVALDPLPNGGLLTGPTSLFGSVKDPSLVRWELAIAPASGGTFVPIISDDREPMQPLLYLWSILPGDGDWRLRLSAIDRGGQTSQVTQNLTIDTTPPGAPFPLNAVSVVYGDAPLRFSRVTLSWAPVADPGLAGYWVYRNGIKLSQTLLTATTFLDDPVPDGDWRYQVRAVDLAGNLGDFADAPLLTLDTVAPQPLITQPRAGDVIGGLTSITGSITDARLANWTLEFSETSSPGAWTMLTISTESVSFGELYQWLVSGLQPGSYQLRLRARDTFGNVGEVLVAVVVETEAPAKPAIPAVSETANGLKVTWPANAEADIAHYRIYRNDSFVGTDTPELPLQYSEALPDGVYVYRIMAVDNAGNRSPISDASAPYKLDLRDPHVVWLNPLDGTRFEAAVQLEVFSADKDILSVQFQFQPVEESVWTDIANDGEAPWTALWVVTSLPQGAYRLRAVAVERDSGDIDPNPDVITVGLGDATPPPAPVIESYLLNGAEVTLTWTALPDSDLAGYRIYRGTQIIGETDASTTTFVDVNGILGTQTYTITALDAVDNESEASEGIAIHIFRPHLDGELAWAEGGVAVFTGSGDAAYGQVEARLGSDVLGTATVDALGRFSLAMSPNQDGFNEFEIVQIHPDGHVSLAAVATALVAGLPQPVTDLVGAADGATPENVDLSWNEPVPAAAGYLVRVDGTLRQGMGRAAITSAAASSSLSSDHRMIDGNVDSFWLSSSSDSTRKVTLTLSEPSAVTGLHIQWYTFYGMPSLVHVEAHIDGRLVPLWSFAGNLGDDLNTLDLGITARTVVTDQLVLTFTHSSRVGIREVEVLTQQFLPTGSVSYRDTDPGAGLHTYEVLSLSSFGRTAATEPLLVGIGDYTAPEPPTGLSATVDGPDVTLMWAASASTDVASYRIYRDGRILATVPDLAYFDGDLHQGQYSYRLTAIDGSGNESEASAAVIATVEVGIEPPELFGFVDGTTVRLQWNYGENPQLQTFRVYRRKDSNGPFQWVSDPGAEPWTEKAWQDGGPLSAAADYAYRVAAVDAQNRETYSNTLTLSVPVPAPSLYFPGSVGTSVTLFDSQAILTGYAEPGTRLGIYKDNQSWAEVETNPQLKVFTDNLSNLEPLGLALSPNGQWLVHSNRTFPQLTLKNLVTQDRSNIWVSDRAANPVFNPSSSLLAFVDRADGAETGMLEIMDLETENRISPYPDGSVRGPLAWLSNGTLVFSTGTKVFTYDPRRQETRSLYSSTNLVILIAVDAGSDRVILRETTPSGTTRISSVSVQGTRLTWLETSHSQQYAWSPSARQLTAVDGNGALGYLLIGLDGRPVAAGLDAKGNLVDFSSLVGVSSDGRTLISQQTSGALAMWNIAASHPIYLGELGDHEQAWAPSWALTGELLSSYRQGSQFNVKRYLLPGFFRTTMTGLNVGPNYLSFDALEPVSQMRSSRTESLLVNYSLELLPDLQVSEDSLRLFPSVVVPGDAPVVQANVRNLGGGDGSEVVVRWSLTAPDQSVREPHDDQVVTVSAGALATVGFQLDTTTFVPGTYSLGVFLDPDNLMDESDEDNNVAARTFIFAVEDGVTLEVALDSDVIDPLGDISFAVQITNLGSSLNDVRVVPRVETIAGTVLAELPPWHLATLAAAAQEQNDWFWSTTTLLAGDYRLVVGLAVDGEAFAERTLDFTIMGDPSAELSLAGLPDQINAPTAIAPQVLLINTSSNVAFSHLTWRAELRDSSGLVVSLLNQNLPIVLPGADHLFHFNFETAALVPGDYVLVLDVFENGVALVQAQKTIILISQPIYRAGVSLYVSPFNLQAGAVDVEAEGVISNTGNRPFILDAELDLVDANGAVLANSPQSLTLAPGETGSLETRFPTAGLLAGTYTVRLHNDSQVGAALTLSKSANLTITSNRAPQLVISGIPENGHASGDVTLLIQVLDDETPLPEAFALLNGEPYVSGTGITQEGYYTLQVTVTDASGSQVTRTENFDIDLSPPQISVTNIGDGDVVYGAVVPEILVQDLNITTTQVTLNGEPYLNGQLIATPGVYTLHIESSDVLGHESQLTRSFTLAESLPLLELTGISDGGRYREARTVGVNLLNGAQLDSFRINGADQNPPFLLQIEGAVAISARATLNGNSQDVTAVVLMDFTPPLILVQGVTHLAHYKQGVQPVALVDGQPTSTGVLLDGNPFVSGTPITAEGTHQLHIQAYDLAGNMSVKDIQWTQDYTVPQLAVFGVEDGGLYTDTRMISWVASDDWLAGVSAYLNDQVVISPLNLSEPGVYSLRISARDQAGNSVSRQLDFTVATGYLLTVTAEPEAGGTVSGSGTWPDGTDAAIAAVPAEGYRFEGWTGAGVANLQQPATTVAMTQNRLVTAQFVRTWDLTVVADPEEGGTVAGSGVFDEGSAAPISAVPAAGYRFNGWLGEDIADPAALETTVLMAGERLTTAQFGLNAAPFLAHPIVDQVAVAEAFFNFTLPDDTFADADPGDSLSYDMTLADDGVLPNWLTFDPIFRELSGTPQLSDVGVLLVKATVRDELGESAFDVFLLTVEVATPSEISGLVFEDLNQNGRLESGESGLAGRTLFLDLNRDGVFDSGEPTQITGPEGTYGFQDVEPGAYVLRALDPDGWQTTVDRDGLFGAAQQVPAGVVPSDLAVGDLNGDAFPELVLAGGDELRILSTGPEGFLSPVNSLAGGPGLDALAIVDFSGDGIADIVSTRSAANEVALYINRGDGSFDPAVTYAAGAQPVDLVTADFDGDADADVVVLNSGSETVSLLLNNSGVFEPAQSWDCGQQAARISTADFNGDGYPELVVTSGQGSLRVLTNQSGAGFGAPVTVHSQAGLLAAVAADWNGDGAIDLAVPSQVSTSILILLNDGAGGFSEAASLMSGGVIAGLASADLELDGDADLLATVSETDALVFFENRAGQFAPARNFATPFAPGFLTLADLSDDGDTDPIFLTGESDFAIAGLANDRIRTLVLQPGQVREDIHFGSVQVASLQVVSPNGGESFAPCEDLTLAWSASDSIATVDVELSRDGGQSWELLFAALENDSSEVWRVMGEATEMALVRISDTSQPTRSDVSDSVFSIVEAGLDPEPGDAIDAAADLVIHSQVTIASCDSRLGPQGGTNVGQAGHIRSGGSLDIHANALIFGDVRPGSPSGAQAVPVPSGLVSQGNLSLKNKETRTLAAGDYLFDAIDMKNASVLQTQGPVRIWFRSLNLNSSARIEPLGSQPKDMRLYGRVSDGSVDLKAHSSIYGFIYTPAGDVVVRSHARVYGAITGDQVTVHAHAQIHRDVALGDGGPNCIDPPTAPETPFVDRAVIAVAGDVIVRDGGYTDSYDSCLGPHGNGNQGSNGHIQAAGEIQQGYSTAINGQLYPNTASDAEAVPIPAGLISAGDLVIQSGNTLYLPAGNYLLNNLTLNSGGNLLGRGGPVRIWYTGSLTVNSHSVLEGQDRMPANLVLYGQGSGRVELKAHGQIFGLVYSPGQSCTVNSHSHLLGAVVAAEAEIKSSGKVHFDEALMHGCQTKRADDPPDGSLPGKPVRSQKGRQQ